MRQKSTSTARLLCVLVGLNARVGQPIGESQAFQPPTPSTLYAGIAGLIIERDRAAEALAMVERGRGQGLARQIAQNSADLSDFLTSEEVAQLEGRTADLNFGANLVRALEARPTPTDAAAKEKLERERVAARTFYEDAERRLSLLRDGLMARYPEYRKRRVSQPPTPQDLLELARRHPDTLYLEWALLGDGEALLFALSHQNGIQTFNLSFDRRLLTTWRDALLTQSPSEPELARRVYDALLAPAFQGEGVKGRRGERVKRKSQSLSHPVTLSPFHPFTPSRIVIVADGPLLDIPFAALRDEMGQRLIERFPLSHAISLGVLIHPGNHKPPSGSLLCVADPTPEAAVQSRRREGAGSLPFARKEGKVLVGLFRGAVGLFGKAAREADIKREMGKYALLHFATQGTPDSRVGLKSALTLAPEPEGSQEDGLLEAREVVGRKLSARLVVLAAGETAGGQKSGGESVIGLTWAFRAAGVPSIVASQWKVDDAATEPLMVAFYKALKAGQRKDDALREAMLLVKKEKPTPFYWAAFQLIGETGPLPK